jgi:predicted PurR-regulated permease PerM
MREFFKSVYVKAGVAFVFSGAVIILINQIVNHPESVTNVLDKITSVMMPIYLGLILAFVMCPIYNKLVKGIYGRTSFAFRTDKKSLIYARAMSSFIVLVIMLVTLTMFFVAIVPQIITNIVGLITVMPIRLQGFQFWAEDNLGQFPQIAEAIKDFANSSSETVIQWIQANVLKDVDGSLAAELSYGIFSTVRGIMNIFIGVILCIYLLNYKERLFAQGRKAATSMFSQKKTKELYEFMNIANDTFIGYLVGRIIDAFVIGCITYASMRFFGLPYPLLISVLIGITNLIPFFGPFIGAIPAFGIIFLVEPMQSVYFLIMILFIQQLDGNVIGPRIVGDSIGLSSFWVIVAILVGGGFFGFIGMFLGVPIFAIIYIYVDKGVKKKLKRKDLPENTEEYLNYEKYSVNKEDLLSGKKRK